MTKRYWRIRGYKSTEVTFDEMIPIGSLTENRLQELLRCLVANGKLTAGEIIGAYVRRKTKLAHDLLEVHKNGPYPEYWCGHDTSFVAIVVGEDGQRVTYPGRP